jgi:hypothetical protein
MGIRPGGHGRPSFSQSVLAGFAFALHSDLLQEPVSGFGKPLSAVRRLASRAGVRQPPFGRLRPARSRMAGAQAAGRSHRRRSTLLPGVPSRRASRSASRLSADASARGCPPREAFRCASSRAGALLAAVQLFASRRNRQILPRVLRPLASTLHDPNAGDPLHRAAILHRGLFSRLLRRIPTLGRSPSCTSLHRVHARLASRWPTASSSVRVDAVLARRAVTRH